MADDDFEFPETVIDLQAVPTCWRALYKENADGFELLPEAATALRAADAAAEAKFRTEMAARDATIAELDAKIAAGRGELRKGHVGGVVTTALHERGAKPSLIRAATALFLSRYQIDLVPRADGGFDATIKDSHGPVPISDAISAWLETEEGQAFKAPPPPSDNGPLTTALRRLREGLH